MTTVSASDRAFMRRAIALAQTVSEDAVAPNPRVGAIIVESGTVVAEGFHPFDGGPHAERVALESLGRSPLPEAEMFVTLEPCSTAGRTGSCCERILQSGGIRRVVIGCLDPNPAHGGRALDLLRAHGITVIWGSGIRCLRGLESTVQSANAGSFGNFCRRISVELPERKRADP